MEFTSILSGHSKLSILATGCTFVFLFRFISLALDGTLLTEEGFFGLICFCTKATISALTVFEASAETLFEENNSNASSIDERDFGSISKQRRAKF